RTPTVSPPTGPKPAAYAISPRPLTVSAGLAASNGTRSGADLGPQPGDVAGGLDAVEGLLDGAVRVDDERGPDHADGGLAVELLLAVGTVGLEHGVIGIGEQREGQALLVPEPGQLGGLVGRDAQDRDARSVQVGQAVAEVAGFLGAAGRHRGRVEVDD